MDVYLPSALFNATGMAVNLITDEFHANDTFKVSFWCWEVSIVIFIWITAGQGVYLLLGNLKLALLALIQLFSKPSFDHVLESNKHLSVLYLQTLISTSVIKTER